MVRVLLPMIRIYSDMKSYINFYLLVTYELETS